MTNIPVRRIGLLGIICTVFFWPSVSAQNFSSSNYTVSDPVIFFPGGYSTSASFGLSSVISQMAIGTSTSSTWQGFGGFLYFPFVSTPAVSATAGDAQVSLTWTSADATLGLAVSGYAVGRSTVSGGPYTYSSVGDVLASTPAGLTNGTAYYFVIRVIDALGNYIATSTQVSATPVASSGGGGSSSGGGSSGGGGGGGGGGSTTSSDVGKGSAVFSGRAYPKSSVTLLKDAQVVATTIAGADATFQVTASGLSAGTYIFSVYSEDDRGNRSSLLTFPVSITAGVATTIGGIFIAPTIAVDKSQVKKGDTVVIFGKTVASSTVTIQVNSEEPKFVQTPSDPNGAYLYNFDTALLEYGDHSTKSKSSSRGEISSYSAAVPFKVGTVSIFADVSIKPTIQGDINNDHKINLVDFSVVAYWYKRAAPPLTADLNKDGKVDLIDFSILAFNWTG